MDCLCSSYLLPIEAWMLAYSIVRDLGDFPISALLFQLDLLSAQRCLHVQMPCI